MEENDLWESSGDELSLSNLGSGFVQPESKATVEKPPKYPYNNATTTECGHSFEMDDTPNRQRIRLQHRSGTFIEMDNGNEVHKVYGNGYEIVIKDKKVDIKGKCSVTIGGDCELNYSKNLIQRVGGDYTLVVNGKLSMLGKKDASLLSQGDIQIAAGSKFLPGDGALRLYSSENVYISSSVMIGGTLNADMIYSKTSVDAGLGMTAGLYGFVTKLGGVSAGLPVAFPGTVKALALVSAPVGSFGIMQSFLMTDIVNKTIFNFHFHTKKGYSFPKVFRMF